MKELRPLTAVTILAALGTAMTIKALIPASLLSQPNVTISIEALHRQVDLKSLREQEIKDLYYPSHSQPQTRRREQ